MPPAVHPLRCRCGALQGHVELEGSSNSMVCYCQDCQPFARFLGPVDNVLDAQGGSDVVLQLAPLRIKVPQGAEHVALVRLSDKGMLVQCLATALLRILGMVAGSRLSGRYKSTPFFTASGAPVAAPMVLTVEARARLQPMPDCG